MIKNYHQRSKHINYNFTDNFTPLSSTVGFQKSLRSSAASLYYICDFSSVAVNFLIFANLDSIMRTKYTILYKRKNTLGNVVIQSDKHTCKLLLLAGSPRSSRCDTRGSTALVTRSSDPNAAVCPRKQRSVRSLSSLSCREVRRGRAVEKKTKPQRLDGADKGIAQSRGESALRLSPFAGYVHGSLHHWGTRARIHASKFALGVKSKIQNGMQSNKMSLFGLCWAIKSSA